MEDVARVVLALEEHDVAEEVMHFLDRTGRARVVATAGDGRQLAEAVRQLEPDVVVAQPSLVDAASLNGGALIAIDTRESVASLRTALRAGARGYFLWPSERDGLVGAAAVAAVRAAAGEKRATVVAVYGPRGGSGTTFVATHLAAACARRATECVLIDVDPVFAELTAACGASREGEAPRTIADLAPLVGEITPAHLQEVLWTHPDGFGVLLAPEPERAASIGEAQIAGVVDAASRAADVIVLHLPRSLNGPGAAALSASDRVLIVLSLDVLSFHAAKRAVDHAGLEDADFVVNRARRAEVSPRDVERVFGRPAFAVIPFDANAPRAQDEGRLLSRRGRTGRAFDRLAAGLLEGSA